MPDNYTMIIIILSVLIGLSILMGPREPFSASGLSISDSDCDKLAQIYYKPYLTKGQKLRNRICDKSRRSNIDYLTGNYETYHGKLF